MIISTFRTEQAAAPPLPPPPAPPPPSGTGSVPASPTMFETTGSLVAQMNIMFWKPSWLANGEDILGAPVTDTIFYLSTSDANARAGIAASSRSAGTASSTGVFGVSAGLWYITALSFNANGASSRSQVFTVTVT